MNRIELAVTSVASQMTALEVGAGIVPVAAATTTRVLSAQRTVQVTVPTILQTSLFVAHVGGGTAATHYTTFMGESSGLSVGDLLQVRRGL